MAKSRIPVATPATSARVQTFCVRLEGISPLLQHRFSETAELPSNTRSTHVVREDPRTVAERAAYRDLAGNLYFPAMAITRLLREAAASHKQTGSRRSMKYVVPGAIVITQDVVGLWDNAGKPIKEFEVDSRPVVIPATKGRIMRHRPRLNAWEAAFYLEIDTAFIDPAFAHQLLIEGGQRIGIGDFRPEKGGPFGRFQVVAWGRTMEET